MTEHDRLIEAARRAARRLGRTQSLPHQSLLDTVARSAGRRNWSSFMADPAPLPQEEQPKGYPAIVREFAPLEYMSSRTSIDSRPIRIPDGDGIVLGVDDDGRVLRSARRSLVLCTGHPGLGKTTSAVFCTIASSPRSSQVISDRKGELVAGTLALGLRGGTDLAVLDAIGVGEANGLRRVAFNPLHPAFRDSPDAIWAQAMAVASCMMDVTWSGYEHCRMLFGMIVMRMVATDGMPSIPRVAREVTEHFFGRDGKGLSALRPYATGPDATAAMEALDRMYPSEAAAALNDLWTAVHDLRLPLLEPASYDDGAELAHMFDHPDTPATLFLLQDLDRPTAAVRVNAMAVDAIGRARARKPHAVRPLQLLLDDAPRTRPSAWFEDALRNEAPPGTSILLVEQILHGYRGSQGRRMWAGANQRAVRADHVLAYQQHVEDNEAAEIRLALGLDPDDTPLASEPGSHLAFDRTGVQTLSTAFVLPPRRPRNP